MPAIKQRTEFRIGAKPITGLLIATFFTTIYFNPSLEDPFNSPKLWVLMISGCWISGYLITSRNNSVLGTKSAVKKVNFITFGFVFFLFISTLLTDIKYTAFFGEAQRRTGFLTYLFLTIFLVVSVRFFRIDSLNSLYSTIFVTGFVLAAYGLIQGTGNDFIKWNNSGNQVIGTLGNSNFAAAIMAVMLVFSFSLVFISGVQKFFRISNLILSLVLLYVIYLTNARQGLVSLVIGLGFFTLIMIFNLNKKAFYFTLFISLIVSVISVMGMLQVGPLKEYLYKGSVSVRGFYWRAGVRMFVDHPFTGVGIDRYGVYFKQYREPQYPLNYGYSLNSTNAHNVPIQLFATGGFFVGLFYILLISFIFYRGIFSIRVFSGTNRLKAAGVFSAWLTFQAQSIISIDNIGLSIWGWVLGGAVIGVSMSELDKTNLSHTAIHKLTSKQHSLNLGQPVISGFLALIAIILSSVLYRGESATFKARVLYPEQSQSVSQEMASEVYSRTTNALGIPLIEPLYKLKLADYMFAYNKNIEAIYVVDALLKSDPINLDYLSVRAGIAESASDWNQAIDLRKRIVVRDPWNALNYYRLGLNYKQIKDFASMDQMLRKIQSIAPNTAEAESARIELVV